MRLLALVALAFTAAPAAAQPGALPPAADGLTLAEAVALAVEASPDVARARVAESARGLAVRAASNDRLPSLDLQVQPSQRYGLTFDQTTGQLVSQTVETMSAGVGANVTLYDGGRSGAIKRQARIDQEAAGVTLERVRDQVAVDVAERFLQFLLDRELVAIQRGQLEAAEAQLDRAERLVEAGARPRSDLPAQRAAVAERRAAVVEAEAAVARDRVRVLDAAGLDPFAEVEIVGPDLDALAAAGLLGADVPDAAALVARARAQRRDLQVQELSVAAAEAGVGVARAAGRPSLLAFGNVGTGYSSLQQRLTDPNATPDLLPVTLDDGTPILLGGQPFAVPDQGFSPEIERTPLFTQLGDNRSGSLGLTLNVPLFDRFATRRAVAEARIRTEEARIQRDDLYDGIAAEIGLAAVEVQGAAARLGAADAQVEAARAAVEAEEARYALGQTTPYDLADARTRLAEALAGRAQAAYTLVFRRALLRVAAGDTDVSAFGL